MTYKYLQKYTTAITSDDGLPSVIQTKPCFVHWRTKDDNDAAAVEQKLEGLAVEFENKIIFISLLYPSLGSKLHNTITLYINGKPGPQPCGSMRKDWHGDHLALIREAMESEGLVC